ncbi:MAG: bifunctional 2',3'-cyclic-nucleotide 2'-phosphodiesterase/3'-nucleotidase [Pseudomonadota bacterium]
MPLQQVQTFLKVLDVPVRVSRYSCEMLSDQTGDISAGPKEKRPQARLRILETTDLHMHLLDYDYFIDQPEHSYGLIQLLEPINSLRNAPRQTTLLFDNGDFLQGNPLADYLAALPEQDGVHPMIHAFNVLGYDAITLGNHEFNYGLDFLRDVLRDADCPVLCSNITDTHDPPLARSFQILTREMDCDDGQTRAIHIGVVGFVPPQIMQWDRDVLGQQIEAHDIVASAHAILPKMKAAGADIIVALCHSGLGGEHHTDGMENAAIPLAAVPGIDAVLTGHTHETFPDSARTPTPIVDPVKGTLHGKPAVMAGFYGKQLGVIDLDLQVTDRGWQVVQHDASLKPGIPGTMATKKMRETLTAGLQRIHRLTLDHIRHPITRTDQPIHTYFATILPDLSQQIMAQAQREHVLSALAGSPNAHLPIISATSPFMFGGKSGPGHYIDIPRGAVSYRDAVTIYPFANALCAIEQSGADLRAWLERAAAHFAHIAPGTHDLPLIAHHSPGYDYDTLDGLTYQIDLSRPARYTTDGRLKDGVPGRIRELCYAGEPVHNDDHFILAANSYRASGGGNYPAVKEHAIVYRSKASTRDILVADLRSRQAITQQWVETWTFAHMANTSVTFLSSPKAQGFMTDKMRHLGTASDGFETYQLIL